MARGSSGAAPEEGAPIARGGRPTTFNDAVGLAIITARKCGAKLRHCAEAAGVPWRTCKLWLERGRAWNDGDHSDIGARAYAAFAFEIDRAGATVDTELSRLVLDGAKDDPRLAFDIMRWRTAVAQRNADTRLAKARARIAEREASAAEGTGPKSSLEVPTILAAPRLDPDAPTSDP